MRQTPSMKYTGSNAAGFTGVIGRCQSRQELWHWRQRRLAVGERVAKLMAKYLLQGTASIAVATATPKRKAGHVFDA